MRSQFVLQEIWIGLRRNLTMSIALVVVVAISLALFGTGLLFMKQVDSTRTYWTGKVEVSIYLCNAQSFSLSCKHNGAATEQEKSGIVHDLQSLPQVAHVYHETQAQAYARFKQEYANQPAFVNTVQPGEIPESYRVKLRNPATDFSAVADTVQGRPGVDQVMDERTILDKFYKLLNGARNAVLIIALILIVAAIMLVGNTIRLSAYNRRRETGIMRLVGASNSYIQLPFVLEGVVAGAIGWVISAVLLYAVKALWLDNLQQYFTFNVRLTTTDLVEVVVLSLCVGVLICAGASFVTLRRYLRI